MFDSLLQQNEYVVLYVQYIKNKYWTVLLFGGASMNIGVNKVKSA